MMKLLLLQVQEEWECDSAADEILRGFFMLSGHRLSHPDLH